VTSRQIGRLDANTARQAVLAIVCFCVLLFRLDRYGASELSGGWLTGRLFRMADASAALFVVAVIVTFIYPRVAAGLALVASLLCAPLYAYIVAPGLYLYIFDGESSVLQRRFFIWDNWAAAGLAVLLVTAIASVRTLFHQTMRSTVAGVD